MFAGVELGGTKCICILGSGPDDIRDQVAVPTTTPDETLGAIAAILGGWDFRALGIAGFGPLQLDPAAPDYGCVVNSPKRSWNGANLLTLAGDKPCTLDTDVNGAALAEGHWGAAQGLDCWAYITVGTGIGVGSISGRQPLRGLAHSEAGHQRVPRLTDDRFAGICAFHGDCVEGMASGPAIEARAKRKGSDVAPDDPAWGFAAHAIAMLCHNLVLTSLPQRILIGGGVATGQPQLLGDIRARLVESLAGYAGAVLVADVIDNFLQPPGLGSRAGPLGALALAQGASCAPSADGRPK